MASNYYVHDSFKILYFLNIVILKLDFFSEGYLDKNLTILSNNLKSSNAVIVVG